MGIPVNICCIIYTFLQQRRMAMLLKICLFLLMSGLLNFSFSKNESKSKTEGGKVMQLKSQAFKEGEMIPAKYTCDAEDISPPLSWDTVPGGTKSLALICDDPDAPAGTWVHWVIYDLPADIRELKENIPPQKELENTAKQGMTDFRKIGYGGPCPPGGTHRYFFKLYALDAPLKLEAGITKAQLLKAMEGHVLAEAKLMGKYKR
jgi:Raf kinase inhibitor-like YbhB/YbcL family protein